MNIITTISPSHINQESQIKSVKSWLDLGFEVYSINHLSEIEALRPLFKEVKFIEVKRTMFHLFNKHLIPLDLMLELGSDLNDDIVCLINSDIELTKDKEKLLELFKRAKSGICLVSRYNYDSNIEENSIEKFGLDIFCFHKKFIELIPKSQFTIGRPLFDYWIPYHFAINNVPIYSIHDRISFHKKHPLQWNKNHWRELSKDFRNLGHFNDVTEKQRETPSLKEEDIILVMQQANVSKEKASR